MSGSPLSGSRSLSALALGALVLLTPRAEATTYYVASSGSDANACSSTAPCRQIRRGLALAGPGDTVLVADGDYLGFDVRDRDGVAGSPITIKAVGSAARVLKTTDRSDNRDTILVSYSNYVVLDGLRSYSANRAAIRVSSSDHVTVRNGVYGSNATWGIFTDFSNDLLLENNECYGSVSQHGIYVSNSGDRPVVRGNRVHDNRASGIQLNADVTMGGDGLITGALIEKNVVYNNGAGGGGAINLDGVQSSTVRNNLLYNNHATGIVNYKYNGAQGPKGMEILNNTVYQASDGRYAVMMWHATGTNRMRNNILYHPSTGRGSINYASAADVTSTDSDYNVITKVTPDDATTLLTLAQWQAQGHEMHSITSTPTTLFVDVVGLNFRLRAGSPAIDRGTALTTVTTDIVGSARPAGAGWDLGAYEGTSAPVTGAQAVAWVSVVGATVSGSTLTKTAITGWANSGAISSQQIASGSGYVEVTATDVVAARVMFGLSHGNTDSNYTDIDFGLYQKYGYLQVYEAGVVVYNAGATYAVGDKLRVSVANGVVTYLRNGVVFYTSKKVPVFPLLLDSAIYTQASTLGSAIIKMQ